MATGYSVPSFFTPEYASNWESVVQTKGGKVAQYCTPDPSFTGKEKWYNQIDEEDDFVQQTARMQPTVITEVTGGDYRLQPRSFDKTIGFDEWDDALLGQIALPDSEAMQEVGKAWARQQDGILFDELLGSRTINRTTPASDALPSSQKIAVNLSGSSEGLTFLKIVTALEKFGENDVDFSEEGAPVLFLRQKQISDLYVSVNEFRDRDYSRDIEPFNKDKLVVEGTIMWMGIQFVKSQKVPLITPASPDIYALPMFCKSALKYMLETPAPLIDVRADLSHTLQIRHKGRIGAVRTQNEKVVEIAVDESP